MDWGRFKEYKKIVGIDPGGYELGVSLFEDGVLQSVLTLFSDQAKSMDRRHSLYERILSIIQSADLVICEEPFLRGTANINMQRMLGVFEYLTHKKICFIHPTSVKKWVVGDGQGHAEKVDVARSLLLYLSDPEKKIVEDIIHRESWNESDAVAVTLGWIKKQLEGKPEMAKAKKGKKGKGKGKGC